ncbi:phosphatase PAP2 family protein [Streptomyces meridianus]|uniref:Phosphatase PAP2 family protein n=1 Tax=Streptomyces meridianus TaxID=2938945 RepID=A0ABT0X208_9ACTN|nr:phosphatase PAP2 family protein [Streptomyces meridianus]MCM2576576.1 phosphatase PAP2 family protein [Streptomyces meridianus]
MRTDRVFARLEQEPERPSNLQVPRMSRIRRVLFGMTLVVYAAIVGAVLTTTRLVRLDWQVMLFRPYQEWPEWHAFLDYFVVLGQRGPTAVLVAAWLGWRSWRQRTLRPLLALGVALLLLNVTVGAVKIGLGRLGPHYATSVGSAELFAGGDIFPSGHTANAVVTWGVLAYLATTPSARRVLSVVGAVFALGVGATTVYLGTHWVSDVLLGWAAGLLILLGLPWFEPSIAWAEQWILAHRGRLRERRGLISVPPLSPVAVRAAMAAQRAEAGDPVAPHTGGAGSRAGHGTAARNTDWPHHPARPHTSRSERTPVTPSGSRRPQHPDRAPRTAPLGPSTPRGRASG